MRMVCLFRAVILLFFISPAVIQAQRVSTPSRHGDRARNSPGGQAQSQDSLLSQGISAFESGDMATARTLLKRALAVNPRSVEAYTWLGIIDDREGALKDAESNFAAAVRLAPNSASARNNHGAILLRLNETRRAEAEFTASLKLDPNQPNALVNLAQIRFNTNTPEGLRAAADLFKRADALSPDPAIARSLTIIELRLQDLKQAREFYRIYAARLSNRVEGQVESGSEAATAHSQLGAALFEAGLYEEAEAELKSAMALEPANAEAVVRLGRVYVARKDLSAAGRLLEMAVAENRADAAVYALLAIVYEGSGHYEHAIPALRRAIQLEPHSEKYHFQYGLLLSNAEAPGAAVIRLTEALKSFERSSRLWLALGIAHLKAGQNVEAAKAVDRAIELNPEDAKAHAFLGLIRFQAHEYKAAVACYEQALRLDADQAMVHQMIAEALMNENESDNARIETELKKAIALDTTLVQARLSLGAHYSRLERWTEALSEFQEVVRLDANQADAYYRMVRVLVRLNRKTEAQEVLAKFKLLSDSQKEKSEAGLRELVRRLADVRF